MVEFKVGNRPRRRPDVFPIHPHDKTDQGFCLRENGSNIAFLVGDFGPAAFDKANIVRASLQADSAERGRVKDLWDGCFRPIDAHLVEMFYSWMLRQLRHWDARFSYLCCSCDLFFSGPGRRWLHFDRNQVLRRLPKLPVDEIRSEAAQERQLSGLPWPNLEGP